MFTIAFRSTKLTAIEDSIFAVLPLDSYQQLLHKHKMKNIEQIVKFLLDIPYFQNCNRYSIYLTQYYFDMKNYIKGQNVCVAGNNLDYLYIVKDGEFEVRKYLLYIYIYIDKNDNSKEIRES